MTGFAIILVVIGHIVAREPPLDNAWYVSLKFYIYQFHMPLFMFMSGLVFRYTYTPVSTLSEYWTWASKKILRLAPGFILVGLAITLGKALSGNVIHVDNGPDDPVANLVRLFVQPTESAASSLWYIYVLLEFYLLFPILNILCRDKSVLVLGVVIAMHVTTLSVRLPDYFALRTVFEFGLYFWAGAMTCRHFDRLLALLRKRGAIFFLIFIASFASMDLLLWKQSQTVMGLASIPAILWLVGTRSGRVGEFFAWIGGYTFVIYLLNTIAIGVTKGLMLKVAPWDGTNFYVYFVVLFAVGMAAPILAHRWVFSRNQTLSRIMN